MARVLFAVLLIGVVFFGSVFLLKSTFPTTESPSATQIPQPQTTSVVNWKEFTAPGKFSAIFPGIPQRASESVTDNKTKQMRHYDTYLSDKGDGTIYMINLITIPDHVETANPEEFLTSFMNDMVATNPKNELVSVTTIDYKGHKALEFVIKNEDWHITNKAFNKGKTVYVLSKLAKEAANSDPEYALFVESFQLQNDTTTPQAKKNP